MDVEIEASKEELLRGHQQSKRLIETQKQDQRWLYFLIAGSFALIVFLNYMFPDVYWVEKRPVYDIKQGFIGLILTFFGLVILMNIIFFIGKFLPFVIGLIILIILLYFGLPLFLGFSW